MDKATTADIDEHDSGFHQGQRLLIHNAIGFRSQRSVQRNKIAFSRESVHVHILNAILGRPFLVWKRVGSEDAHPESTEYFANDTPNLAGAKYSRRLPTQVKPHQAAEREVKLPDPVVSAMGFAVQRQN